MPFQKGVSGNPGGKRKALGLSRGVRIQEGKKTWKKLLQIRDEQVKEPYLNKETGELVYVVPSIKELRESCKLILAYCWGQPSQKLEVTGEDGEPIEHRHLLKQLSQDPRAVELAREFSDLMIGVAIGATTNGHVNGNGANGSGSEDY